MGNLKTPRSIKAKNQPKMGITLSFKENKD